MRLNLKLTKNTEPVPFSYQVHLTGALHKWLGKNNIHNSLSLYTFSWLFDSEMKKKALDFKNGARWFINFLDDNLTKTILSNILQDPEIAFGFRVEDVVIEETPDLSNKELFMLGSPVFIKRSWGDDIKHITYDDPNAGKYLKETLLHKLKVARIEEEDFEINFSKEYASAKTRIIDYKGVSLKSSLCPVIIKGSNEVKQFAWNSGIGNSTGIGFGSLI